MISILYIFLALFYFIFYFKKYNDILHPNMVFLVIWNLSCAFTLFISSNLLNKWSLEMHFVVIFSSIMFFLGSNLQSLKPRSYKLASQVVIPIKYHKYVFRLFIICISCAILEWIYSGAIISLNSDIYDGFDKKNVMVGIPGVHYGTIFLPYVSAFSLFSILNTPKFKKRHLFIIIFSLVFTLISKISRGETLIYMLALFYVYYRFRKISTRYLVLGVVLLLSMLIGFMLFRVEGESVVYGLTENPYVSIFYSYIATCFANLNDLINSDIPSHYFGNSSFVVIWTLFGLNSELPVIGLDQFGVFNARTYLYGFYHDYKLFGVLIFPFILGYLISRLYSYSIMKSAFWIILLAALQKAIFVSFFGNYFTGELVLFFPYLLCTVIIVFLLKNSK